RAQLFDTNTLECRLTHAGGAPQALHDFVGRSDTEVGFDQLPLHRFEPLPVRRPTGEEAADPVPQAPGPSPHQGSPWRRRSAHSVASARVAMTNSHQRSRNPTDATRAIASPGWALSAGASGSHSSE